MCLPRSFHTSDATKSLYSDCAAWVLAISEGPDGEDQPGNRRLGFWARHRDAPSGRHGCATTPASVLSGHRLVHDLGHDVGGSIGPAASVGNNQQSRRHEAPKPIGEVAGSAFKPPPEDQFMDGSHHKRSASARRFRSVQHREVFQREGEFAGCSGRCRHRREFQRVLSSKAVEVEAVSDDVVHRDFWPAPRSKDVRVVEFLDLEIAPAGRGHSQDHAAADTDVVDAPRRAEGSHPSGSGLECIVTMPIM